MSTDKDYKRIDLEALVHCDEMNLRASCPVMIMYGETLSIIVKGDKLKVSAHDSDDKPVKIELFGFGLLTATVFVDPLDDEIAIYHKV